MFIEEQKQKLFNIFGWIVFTENTDNSEKDTLFAGNSMFHSKNPINKFLENIHNLNLNNCPH